MRSLTGTLPAIVLGSTISRFFVTFFTFNIGSLLDIKNQVLFFFNQKSGKRQKKMDFSVVLVSIYLLVVLLLFCGVWIYMFCKRYHRYFDGIVTERHCCRRIIEQLEKSWSKNLRMGSFFSKLDFQFNHSVTRSDCQINEEYDRY